VIFYSEIPREPREIRKHHSAMAPSTRRRVRWAWIAGAGWLVAIVAVFSPRRMAGSERGMEREWVHVADGHDAAMYEVAHPRLGAEMATEPWDHSLGSMDAKIASVTGEASARLLAKTLETNEVVGRLQDALVSDLEASSRVLEGRNGGGSRLSLPTNRTHAAG
jgi:hypothetical protein